MCAFYDEALKIEPDNAEAFYKLGLALAHKGQINEAIAHYQRALEINPDYTEAQNSLAYVLSTSRNAELRNGAKAVELALKLN